jgi:hypothetical protein
MQEKVTGQWWRFKDGPSKGLSVRVEEICNEH